MRGHPVERDAGWSTVVRAATIQGNCPHRPGVPIARVPSTRHKTRCRSWLKRPNRLIQAQTDYRRGGAHVVDGYAHTAQWMTPMEVTHNRLPDRAKTTRRGFDMNCAIVARARLDQHF